MSRRDQRRTVQMRLGTLIIGLLNGVKGTICCQGHTQVIKCQTPSISILYPSIYFEGTWVIVRWIVITLNKAYSMYIQGILISVCVSTEIRTNFAFIKTIHYKIYRNNTLLHTQYYINVLYNWSNYKQHLQMFPQPRSQFLASKVGIVACKWIMDILTVTWFA